MSDPAADAKGRGFVRELGLLDAVMIVTGSMIGSGIFIVSANVARQVGSAGWLVLAWAVSGLLVTAAALSYGELAAMMPRVGGQYVYLKEAYSPLLGFLFGWTLFLVIQSGTIAAVAVAFASFLGVLVPGVSSTAWIVPPIDLSPGYAVSLSVQQLVAILLIVLLSVVNTYGVRVGKLIQNSFTWAKMLALAALIVLGVALGQNAAGFSDPWTPQNVVPAAEGGLPF
ncbi:MAG TPA: amino acid permease, partial [Thermoanaerobaculia bacterium]